MKIRRHPRMQDISVGDEVFNYRVAMYACVEEVFPAAVCVKLTVVCRVAGHTQTRELAQLWQADEIENLNRCCYCGTRDNLATLHYTHKPQRMCATCQSVQLVPGQQFTEAVAPSGSPA